MGQQSERENTMENWNTSDFSAGLLESLLGEINAVEQESPGVCYLSVSGNEEWSSGEYYAVWSDVPNISKEAKSYGLRPEQCPELLLYPFMKDDSGWRIIQYELYKYRIVNRLPMSEESDFIDTTLHSIEIHPEYFGLFPVPVLTPWGYTLRHKMLDNGVYWLETNQCQRVLSVCFPIYQELSSAAVEIAIRINYAPEFHVEGPLFFNEQACCIPIWELMRVRRQWESKIVDKAALMNAIWQYFPEYATIYNTQVQQGLQDAVGLLLNAVDIQVELKPDTDDVISISSQAGIDFLRL